MPKSFLSVKKFLALGFSLEQGMKLYSDTQNMYVGEFLKESEECEGYILLSNPSFKSFPFRIDNLVIEIKSDLIYKLGNKMVETIIQPSLEDESLGATFCDTSVQQKIANFLQILFN